MIYRGGITAPHYNKGDLIMIIAIIKNMRTGEIFELPVRSCEVAENIVFELNGERLERGFYMIMDYEADNLY